MNDKPKKSETRCNDIKFKDLCVLFEKMQNTAGSANKLRLLFNKDMKTYLSGQSIFPLLRLVLPLNDTDRGSYGLKQASVAKTYVNALHLDLKTSEDARRLLNWKDPSKAQGVEASKMVVGDFGMILEDILKARVRSDYSNITVGAVNQLLDSLANAASTDEKTNIIRNRILNEFNANEQKWLARIIFRDLKVGLKHEQVLSGFYPNALKRYNECTNLKLVCEEEGISSELMGIQVGTKFSPMLAKGFATSGSSQVATVEAAMKQDPFVMDIKLDGERMQCHVDFETNSVQMFTRRGNDYTENYLPLAQIVRDNLLATDQDSGTVDRNKCKCIIDGEVCAWDILLQKNMPFGNNLSVAKVERELRESFPIERPAPAGWDRNLPSCMMFVAFDIVYLDGEGSGEIIDQAMAECGVGNRFVDTGEIMNLPLAVRRKILARLIRPVPNRLDIVKHRMVIVSDQAQRREAIESFFNEVTVAGEEGLVIKNLASTYELGEKSRGTGSWVKMKPEYGDQTEDLDLLILGAYYGEGTGMRGEGLSTFLCGVRDDDNPGGYRTLCKVGTGYSFDELRELREKLRDVIKPWKERAPPAHLAHWYINKRDDRPNVYIPPEQSIVVQLKCAELVDSNAFSAGITCRFPRLQRIRYDKAPAEVMKLSEVVELKNRVRDTTHQVLEKHNGVSKKQKKSSASAAAEGAAAAGGKKRTHAVDDQFRVSNKKVNREGRLFEGSVFCVLESDFVYGKAVDFSMVEAPAAATAVAGSQGSKGNAKSTQNSSGSGGSGSNTSSQRVVPQGLTQLVHSPVDSQFTQMMDSLTQKDPTQQYDYGEQLPTQQQATQFATQQGTQDSQSGNAVDNKGGSGGVGTLRRYTREEVINEIKRQGGEVMASPTLPECKIVAGSKRTFQLNNHIERGDRDVLDFSYLIDCVKAGELLPLKSVHLLGMSPATRKSFVGSCNVFGDSYSEDTTVAELQKIFQSTDSVLHKMQKQIDIASGVIKVPKKRGAAAVVVAQPESEDEGEQEERDNILRDWKTIKDLGWRELCRFHLREEEREPIYFSALNCLWSDRTVFYLDMYIDLGPCDPPRARNVSSQATALNTALVDASNGSVQATIMKVLYHRILCYGGTVADNLHGEVTHIVMFTDNTERAGEIKDRIRLLRTADAHSYEKRVVSTQWVQRCIEAGRMDEPTARDLVPL